MGEVNRDPDLEEADLTGAGEGDSVQTFTAQEPDKRELQRGDRVKRGKPVMPRDHIVDRLLDENPDLSAANAFMYADIALEYFEAVDNIERVGPIVLHPRTGEIIDNPYRKLRDAARSTIMSKFGNVGAGWLWLKSHEKKRRAWIAEIAEHRAADLAKREGKSDG